MNKSVYLLMWEEVMRQIGEDYPGVEKRRDGYTEVKAGHLSIEFYDDKRIYIYGENPNYINLFKLYQIWNEHEKTF
jgi:hypothetical protein